MVRSNSLLKTLFLTCLRHSVFKASKVLVVEILTNWPASTYLEKLSLATKEKQYLIVRFMQKDTHAPHPFKRLTNTSRPVLSLLDLLLSQAMMKRSSSSNLFQPRKLYLPCFIEDPEMDGKLLTSTLVLTTRDRL